MNKRTLAVLGVAALCLSCRKGPAPEQVILAGSTSVQPFVEMVAEQFMRQNPGVSVVVQGGGSTAGIQAVRQGAAAIGMCSRDLDEQEKDLKSLVIARDGLAVIVHRANPVSSLTTEQVRGIFVGRIKDWAEVGGPAGPIRVVTREEGSGTRGAFQEMVMHKDVIGSQAMVQDSNGSMREVIANDPGGIGYMSLGQVNEAVKAVDIDGVKASHDTVQAGTYKLVRPFLFVYQQEPQGAAKQFVDFVIGPDGQRLFVEEGLIRAK